MGRTLNVQLLTLNEMAGGLGVRNSGGVAHGTRGRHGREGTGEPRGNREWARRDANGRGRIRRGIFLRRKARKSKNAEGLTLRALRKEDQGGARSPGALWRETKPARRSGSTSEILRADWRTDGFLAAEVGRLESRPSEGLSAEGRSETSPCFFGRRRARALRPPRFNGVSLILNSAVEERI